MRTICLLAVFLAIAILPGPRIAVASSMCDQVEDPYFYKNCISDLADMQCRGVGSFAAHQECFIAAAQQLLGDRINEVEFAPECHDYNGYFVECVVNSDGYGAPDNWCIRLDVNRIQQCEGDPPNHVCGEPESCPVTAGCVCWTPN